MTTRKPNAERNAMSDRKLTPKGRVLKKYPLAFAETCGAEIMQIVTPLMYGEVKIIGAASRACRQDATAKRDAWAAAARKLKERG